MEIIPAILPKTFREIEEKVPLIVGLSKIVQIDICDGKYVPSTTWPYWKQDENFEKVLREEIGMPRWENINYEFDLMIDNPGEDDARKWLSAGATRIILHLDSSKDLNPIIDVLHGLVEIGLAVNNSSDISNLEKYIQKIQFIQCMGIKKVGFQGQKFESSILEKINTIKKMYPDIPIQVDGGVTLDNANLLKNAQVDRLVVGSALFQSDNIVDTYNNFKNI
jgi:ribulose-phosphate 3-epimerase